MKNACLGINEKGRLTIGGLDAVELAGQYGTPLYVMDENAIRLACREWRESIERYYGGRGRVLFASKAFCCKEIYRILKDEELGADIVSSGELFTAVSAGFPADRLCLHGNNKTDADLRLASVHDVGLVAVDNFDELERLQDLCTRTQRDQRILLRIKPGVEAHTHEFIRTGQIDSKFGFALETGEALEAVKAALKCSKLKLHGLHCHIGSQIFETEPFLTAAERMVGLMGEIKRKFDVTLDALNLGGGFGISYLPDEEPPSRFQYMEELGHTIRECCGKEDIPLPFLMIEPGRSIVGPAGITLYTAGSRKVIPNVRTYLPVNGGMTDNPRYALYHAEYEAVVADRAGDPKVRMVTLAGRCCESGDLLGENMPIQECSRGDTIAVLATGAYNYSMSNNYNRVPRPAVVMVKDGQSRVVVKRESLEDIARSDV